MNQRLSSSISASDGDLGMTKLMMTAAFAASWPLVVGLGAVAWSCDRAAAQLRLAQSAFRQAFGSAGQEAVAEADFAASEEAWNGAAAKIVAIGRARTLRALRRADRLARLAEAGSAWE